MTATATLKLSLLATLTKALDLATPESALQYVKNLALDDGEGANAIESIWHDQRTLSASASENLDLAGGLTDAYGDAITFNKIKLLLVYAAAGNTNNVLVGGAASAQWVGWVGDATDVVIVRPGGLLLLTAPDATGMPVVATTGDLLKVANSAGSTSVTYDIVLLGEVA